MVSVENYMKCDMDNLYIFVCEKCKCYTIRIKNRTKLLTLEQNCVYISTAKQK